MRESRLWPSDVRLVGSTVPALASAPDRGNWHRQFVAQETSFGATAASFQRMTEGDRVIVVIRRDLAVAVLVQSQGFVLYRARLKTQS